MAAQTEQAIAECDVVIFILDAREGLTAQDRASRSDCASAAGAIVLVVNKAEGLTEQAAAEFHELGLGEPWSDFGGARRERAAT